MLKEGKLMISRVGLSALCRTAMTMVTVAEADDPDRNPGSDANRRTCADVLAGVSEAGEALGSTDCDGSGGSSRIRSGGIFGAGSVDRRRKSRKAWVSGANGSASPT